MKIVNGYKLYNFSYIILHVTFFRKTYSLWKFDDYFLKFRPKKNKTLSVSVKDRSCDSPQGLQLY